MTWCVTPRVLGVLSVSDSLYFNVLSLGSTLLDKVDVIIITEGQDRHVIVGTSRKIFMPTDDLTSMITVINILGV